MKWLGIAFANLRLSPLTFVVNVALMALGTGSIVLLLLAGTQLSQTLSRDARDIDLVLGATGSPVQLVLSSVYHADVPTGNVLLRETERWANDPRVRTAIPLSLGDSYRGFRIVGTTHDYADLYDAQLDAGVLWDDAMQAVVGSAVEANGLLLGAEFAGAHGLSDGGSQHDSERYQVVGVLKPTGTVLDRLILTSLESVWDLHADEHHDDGDSDHAHDSKHDADSELDHDATHDNDDHDEQDENEAREVTAMLISYQTPLASISLPREVNASGTLQAAAPAMEISRVLRLVGIGFDGLRTFALALVLTAGLSVFAALYGSLRMRQNDLAMLRCLGATRWELLLLLLFEGMLLSGVGVAVGFLMGHGVMELLGIWLEGSRGIRLSGWTWAPTESWLLVGLLGVGVIAAALPALQAYRTDVARTLA
ncbi:MAG: ABC transporter permease, partial [Pseudomonadota bacterium]